MCSPATAARPWQKKKGKKKKVRMQALDIGAGGK
jgi:hypothetical protein